MEKGIIDRIKNCHGNHGALLHVYMDLEKDLDKVYKALKESFKAKIRNYVKSGEADEVKKIKSLIAVYQKQIKDHPLLEMFKELEEFEKEIKQPLMVAV